MRVRQSSLVVQEWLGSRRGGGGGGATRQGAGQQEAAGVAVPQTQAGQALPSPGCPPSP